MSWKRAREEGSAAFYWPNKGLLIHQTHVCYTHQHSASWAQNTEQARKESKQSWGACSPAFMCVNTYFWNFSAKTSSFCLKRNMGRSYMHSLELQIVFVVFGECLCSSNFERDIVDTLCHASRGSDTTRPNKAGFLLQEGRVWRVGQPEMQFKLVWPSRAVNFSVEQVC